MAAKPTERVLLDYIMAPSGIHRDSLVIEQFENHDEETVANTAAKRERVATMISHAATCINTNRKNFMEFIRKGGAALDENKKISTEKFGMNCAVYAIELADKSAIMGYIIGKYGVNNEYLEEYAATIRVRMQGIETLLSDLIEQAKKERDEKVTASIKEVLKEHPDLNPEEARKWLTKKSQ